MNWRITVEPFTRPFMQAWWRLSRGMTLGVRAIVTDDSGRILLIKHTYLPGWHLPGGGVEHGETTALAVRRETEEEAGIRAEGGIELFGIYANHRRFRGDHVVVYRIRQWTACPPDNEGEIEAVDWFDPADLPADISPATQRRIRECLGETACAETW